MSSYKRNSWTRAPCSLPCYLLAVQATVSLSLRNIAPALILLLVYV